MLYYLIAVEAFIITLLVPYAFFAPDFSWLVAIQTISFMLILPIFLLREQKKLDPWLWTSFGVGMIMLAFSILDPYQPLFFLFAGAMAASPIWIEVGVRLERRKWEKLLPELPAPKKQEQA